LGHVDLVQRGGHNIIARKAAKRNPPLTYTKTAGYAFG
jgi:hypothetical protein